MPHYLRASLREPASASAGTSAPLWWPPSKVAGRLLAPYLAELADGERSSLPFEDLEPATKGREDDHRDALELALAAADLDARERDYVGALRWLDLAEQLNLALPPVYVRRRERWSVQREMASRGVADPALGHAR